MQPFSFETIQWSIRKLFLFLIIILVVWLGSKNILAAQNSAAQATRSADLVVVTDNTWSDDFDDMSGLSIPANVQTSGGQLTLTNDALPGSATSILISPPQIGEWGRLYFRATVPLSTNLTIDVLDITDSSLMHNVPSGGNLAGIDVAMYPALKLRAALSSTVAGHAPSLDEWRITWAPDYPYQTYLPVTGNSFFDEENESPFSPLQGAAIGFAGANGENPPGKIVRFPSTRKNAMWVSSFAIQNITDFATTLTLKFFHKDGTIAYTVNAIPLRPHGTYIASLADFPLADGFYALAITATEPIVGMVTTRHVLGKMAMAYDGTSQSSQHILIPLVRKDSFGWTSRLCIQNTAEEITEVTMNYLEQGSATPVFYRQIDIPGNGINCTDLGQEPLPPNFIGAAVITTEDTNIIATVEDIQLQGNLAISYPGFDSSTGSDTIYIPRCWKENNWQTTVLVSNAGLIATEIITVSYHELNGRNDYTYTYPKDGLWTSFFCPDSSPGGITPPLPPPYHLGSAIVSTDQSELAALIIDGNIPAGTDIFSYPAPSVSSTTVYVSNIGAGLDSWVSTLSIQNPNAITTSVKASFYNRTGDVLHELSEELPPYGMGQYEVAQLPGLSVAYEGSAIISAANPVAVLASKKSLP
jgi:hypothetical protein